jgi:hypothetical protein
LQRRPHRVKSAEVAGTFTGSKIFLLMMRKDFFLAEMRGKEGRSKNTSSGTD